MGAHTMLINYARDAICNIDDTAPNEVRDDDDRVGSYTTMNAQGNSQLHLACMDGSLISVKHLITRNLCLVKDKDGRTPLHIAAMRGKVDVLQVLLEACPDSIQEVNATFETCLHTSVVHNKGKAIQYLLTWIALNSRYTHLINAKDYDGNTALHLATSRKQLQTLKAFLTCNPDISRWVQVNAKNSGGFTALDILYVLPHIGKIDLDIEKILQSSGALRTKNNADCDTHLCKKSLSDVKSTRMTNFTRPVSTDILLLVATLLATITFHAALSFPSIVSTNKFGPLLGTPYLNLGDSITTRSFVVFNSVGFIAAVAMLIFILHQFPMKPWPQISVSTLFGSYMCVINIISPQEALPLFSLSIPLLVLAAAGKLFCFRPKGFY